MKIKVNDKGITNFLSNAQKKLKNYRIVFINQMRRDLERIGKFIVDEARLMLLPNKRGLDTGTMRKRTSYKVQEWNTLEVGIYEDEIGPTGRISKYTGRVIPPHKRYAFFVHELHPRVGGFLRLKFLQHAKKMTFEAVSKFNADYMFDDIGFNRR